MRVFVRACVTQNLHTSRDCSLILYSCMMEAPVQGAWSSLSSSVTVAGILIMLLTTSLHVQMNVLSSTHSCGVLTLLLFQMSCHRFNYGYKL